MKTFFYIFILFFSVINSYAQRELDFKKILSFKKIDSVFATNSNYDSSWSIYLGALKDKNKKDKYFVIRKFDKTKAAATWHGHSTIYFFGLDKKLKALVNLSMPDNLPYKLENNFFYFKYLQDGILKIFKSKMEIPLLKVFCSSDNECDLIDFK